MSLGVGALLAPLLSRLRRRLPLVSAGLSVALGAFALALRAPAAAPAAPAASAVPTVPAEPSCHGHH
jgi:hypothetical protein